LDELLSIYVPWSQEFSGVLNFGFKPPASGFQSYSYSSLKTSPSIQPDDKTSTLMVKRFSTVRTEEDRSDQEEKGSQKGREQSSQ